MKVSFLKRMAVFVLFALVQALVCNHIHMFNCATPLVYIYFVLLFRRNEPRWEILVWCFLLGLIADMFSNTQGVAAASMTLLGMIQPWLLMPFLPRESEEDFQPSVRTMGVAKFFWYALIAVFLYCLSFFSLETFNFFNWQQWLLSVGSSTLLTLLLIMAVENLRRS